jgi:hypothetical protein
VPSGVWSAEEYAKLPRYDVDTAYQPWHVFECHHGDGSICAGWLACHGPYELLGVRIGIHMRTVDPSVVDYTTDVDVFGSGAEAAAHGVAEIDCPSPEAADAVAKILRLRPDVVVDTLNRSDQ